MSKITTIEGIGPAFAEKLEAAGVKTVEGLLKACATPKGRKEIEESTGISHKQILRWTNHADLQRIKGIGGEFSELLEAAGVDTVPELAQRNAANLAVKMAEVNAEKELTRRVPTEAEIAGWIAQAKELPRVVQYGGAAKGVQA